LHRTPRGRVATERAFEYFKVERRLRTGEPPALFLVFGARGNGFPGGGVLCRGSRGDAADGDRPAAFAHAAQRARFVDIRNRAAGKAQPAVVPEPGGGGADGSVPTAAAGPDRQHRAATRAEAHARQRPTYH